MQIEQVKIILAAFDMSKHRDGYFCMVHTPQRQLLHRRLSSPLQGLLCVDQTDKDNEPVYIDVTAIEAIELDLPRAK
jgi:hypothetical protein